MMVKSNKLGKLGSY